MSNLEVVQVIRTELERRGNGSTTPIRRIVQYWGMDGELLWEHDPLPEPEPVVAKA
jgi:hypothetical protein